MLRCLGKMCSVNMLINGSLKISSSTTQILLLLYFICAGTPSKKPHDLTPLTASRPEKGCCPSLFHIGEDLTPHWTVCTYSNPVQYISLLPLPTVSLSLPAFYWPAQTIPLLILPAYIYAPLPVPFTLP